MLQNRILLVDDDVLNHWLMTDALTDAGFGVCGLCRGADAVRMLEGGGRFDILVTDFQLPDGISGFELAAAWRRALPGRPVIYTSAFPQMAIGPLQAGEGFVAKHAAASDLLRVVSMLLCESDVPLASKPQGRALSMH